MGFLARLFGTDPASRLAKAEKYLERTEYNEARMELDGLEGPKAEALRAQALGGLVELNLAEAEARFNAGDGDGGREHLAMARQFGATPEQLREARRAAREARERLRAEKAAAAAAAKAIAPEGDDPLWGLPPDDPRLRYAMLLETWPDDLRTRLAELGGDFAKAVLLTEAGKGAQAIGPLGQFVSQEPAARYERARAAVQANQLPLAVSDLKTFGDAVGHRRIGPVHTGVLLSQLEARLGRGDDALATLDALLAESDDLSVRAARAGLLEALGRHERAGKEAEKLLLKAPKDQGLYRLLARTRLRAGDRMGAAVALEGGLAKTCSNPGKCGNQPFDVVAGRMLLRIYLEDRVEPERAKELLGELARHNQAPPQWEDRYIAALVARNDGAVDLPAMAQQLLRELPAGDVRRGLVQEQFPAQLAG
jgi:transposase-like protein